MTTATTGADGGLRIETGRWDELLEADGSARPAAASLVARLRELGLAELQERQDRADLDILTMGITFTVYSDGRGIDRAWPFDVIPRVIDAAGVAAGRSGPRAAPVARSTCFIDDLYNDQRGRRRRRRSRPSCSTSSANFRPECRGVRPPFGVWAHICGSDLVRDARRHDLRARGQPARPVGRQLHAREPADLEAGLRRRCSSARASSRSTATPTSCTSCSRRCAPDGPRHPSVVVLTPGHLQLGLLRALLPRPADGRPARRGPRPRRRRGRRRVHAHDRRAAAGRRDLPPRRRPVPRPRGVPPRLGPRRARPDAGVAGRQRRHRQRARRRRGRRQGRLRLGARPHPLLPRRGAAPRQRADLPLPRTRTSGGTCSTTSTSWW